MAFPPLIYVWRTAGTPSNARQTIASFIGKAARAAITRLKSQGFFCIQDASTPKPPEFLWHLLTFCYAKKIFGSERIVRWLRKEHWIPVKPTKRCPLAQDLRRFRRNNRKILILSLEEFFKKQTCPESKDNRANKTETTCKLVEQLLLSSFPKREMPTLLDRIAAKPARLFPQSE